jgi:hypothetical protein
MDEGRHAAAHAMADERAGLFSVDNFVKNFA